jgi:hypothetical protein
VAECAEGDAVALGSRTSPSLSAGAGGVFWCGARADRATRDAGRAARAGARSEASDDARWQASFNSESSSVTDSHSDWRVLARSRLAPTLQPLQATLSARSPTPSHTRSASTS